MKTFLYVLILISFTSCVTLYVPTPHNSPMFSKKNEFQAAAAVGTALNVRTAYSLTNHFGVTANYLYTNDRALNRSSDENDWRTQSVGELGVGYYTRTNRNLYIDLFAGAGLGEGKTKKTITTSGFLFIPGGTDHYKGSVSYSKFYVQPSIGWTKRIFSWNGSLRVTYINFTKAYVIENDERISFGEKPDLLLSSAGEFRIAIRKDKLYGSAQAGIILISQREEEFFYYEFLSFSVGILLKL